MILGCAVCSLMSFEGSVGALPEAKNRLPETVDKKEHYFNRLQNATFCSSHYIHENRPQRISVLFLLPASF